MSPNQPRVFISYARKDSRYAEKVEAFFRQQQVQTWIDKRGLDPSTDFTGEIEEAIRSASHVVVCLSEDVKRPQSFVKREVAYALAQDQQRRLLNPPGRLPIIPVMFPGGEMPVLISTWTYVSIPDEAHYEQGLKEVLKRLGGAGDVNEQPAYSQPEELVLYLNELHQWASDRLSETVYVMLKPKADKLRVNLKNLFRFDVSHAAKGPAPVAPGNEGIQPTVTEQTYDSFYEAFQACKRRAVLIGKPGAGKTTSLLVMAREAAVARLNDPSEPIPILAQLPNWEFRLRIPDWARKQTGRKVIQELGDSPYIYLLDALDEITPTAGGPGSDAEQLRRFMNALEEELTNHSSVVVSCRADNFLAAFKDQEAPFPIVELHDLTDGQVATFLKSRGQGELWDGLKDDEEIVRLMSTPLLLSIFSYAFEREEVAPEQLKNLTEAKLFDLYVRRRFVHEQAKGGALDFPEEEARRHLSDLAVAMTEDDYLTRTIDRERAAGVLGAAAERFLPFAKRMSFLQQDQHGAVQFVHSNLHAFFAGLGLTERLGQEEYQENSQAIRLLGRLGKLAEPALLRAFSHSDVDVRLAAINAFGLIKDYNPPTEEALAQLRKTALEDPSGRVRELTMKAFVEMAGRRRMSKYESAVGAVLLRGVRDRAEDVRFAAAKALTVYVTKEVVPDLLAVMHKGVENVTMKHLVESLGKARDPVAIPHLTRLVRRGTLAYMRGVPLLHWPVLMLMSLGVKLFPSLMGRTDHFDLSAGTRSKAAWALGEIGCKNSDAVSELLTLLNQGDAHHRITAAEALGKIGDAAAAPALISVLNDEDLHLRSVAAYALGKIGHPSGIDPVLRMLGDAKNLEENVKEHWEKSGERDVYEWVAASLIQEFGADKVLEHGDMKIVLNHLSAEHPLVRVDAAEILGQLGHKAVLHAHVRDKVIVPALIKGLDDEDSSVVLYVIRALERIATPEATAALKVRGLKTPPLFL